MRMFLPINPLPIIESRYPRKKDVMHQDIPIEIGTYWIMKTTHKLFILHSKQDGKANWLKVNNE